MMKIKRTKVDGQKAWTVNFDQKTLDKVSKIKGNANGSSYDSSETFLVVMGVNNLSTGKITRVKVDGTQKTVDYQVSYLEDKNNRMKVRFDFADGRRFDARMKPSRGFATGAFYKFFNYAVLKTPAFLD